MVKILGTNKHIDVLRQSRVTVDDIFHSSKKIDERASIDAIGILLIPYNLPVAKCRA